MWMQLHQYKDALYQNSLFSCLDKNKLYWYNCIHATGLFHFNYPVDLNQYNFYMQTHPPTIYSLKAGTCGYLVPQLH